MKLLKYEISNLKVPFLHIEIEADHKNPVMFVDIPASVTITGLLRRSTLSPYKNRDATPEEVVDSLWAEKDEWFGWDINPRKSRRSTAICVDLYEGGDKVKRLTTLCPYPIAAENLIVTSRVDNLPLGVRHEERAAG